LDIQISDYNKYLPTKELPWIEYNNRNIVIDWIIDVARASNLKSNAYHAATYLYDRCLDMFELKKSEYQLYAVTALLITRYCIILLVSINNH
jgi:hypothetical protein